MLAAARVHVVWREASYCTEVWKRLAERAVRTRSSDSRCMIRRGTFDLDPPEPPER